MAKGKKTKTKAKPANKPAAKKPAAKAKQPSTNKPAANKPATKAKQPSTKKPAANKPAAKKSTKATKASGEQSDVEKQVATMLQDYDDGSIDNAFDVIGDAYELDQELPKTSSLRPAFNQMYRDLLQICAESAGG